MLKYFEEWKPSYAPGTYRTYSNPSIGMLGFITARAMHKDFDALMETVVFPTLGMSHTYIAVPKAEMANYAQGYSEKKMSRSE